VVVVLDPSKISSTTTTTESTRAAFARVIAPLEAQAGRRMGNPHRQKCFEAFERYPHGVEVVARDTAADATRNPLGLFYWRITNGWHELEPLPKPEARAEMAPIADVVALEEDVPVDVRADRLLEADPSLRSWLVRVGIHYAHNERVFHEELVKIGISDPELVAELRRRFPAEEAA